MYNEAWITTALTQLPKQIDHDQAYRLVQEAIHVLPEQRKRVFELRYRLGCSYEQIGEELQISKNTVRNQVVSALRSIRGTPAATWRLAAVFNMVLFVV